MDIVSTFATLFYATMFHYMAKVISIDVNTSLYSDSFLNIALIFGCQCFLGRCECEWSFTLFLRNTVLLLHLITFLLHAWSYDHTAHHGALKPRSPQAHMELASPRPKIKPTQAYFYHSNKMNVWHKAHTLSLQHLMLCVFKLNLPDLLCLNYEDTVASSIKRPNTIRVRNVQGHEDDKKTIYYGMAVKPA